MGGFDVVAVAVLLGGIGQSFLDLKRSPDIFPALGHGVPVQTGIFLSGGGLFSEIFSGKGFWLSGVTRVLGTVVGVCVVAVLASSLATTFTLYFFVGMSHFLFLFALVSFLT